MTQTSELNYLYTMPMEMGTPAQAADILIDINYPATIIWTQETESWNGTNVTNCSGYPNYMNNFYN